MGILACFGTCMNEPNPPQNKRLLVSQLTTTSSAANFLQEHYRQRLSTVIHTDLPISSAQRPLCSTTQFSKSHAWSSCSARGPSRASASRKCTIRLRQMHMELQKLERCRRGNCAALRSRCSLERASGGQMGQKYTSVHSKS